MSYNFEDDNNKAKISEQKFMDWLERNNYKYDDVRYVEEYQALDVDFVMYKDDKSINVEIKSDEGINVYGNLTIELVSNITYNTEGWWHKTTKDGGSKWLLFYSPQLDLFYKIKTEDLKQYISEQGFIRKLKIFNSWCGLISLEKYCKFKGIELDSLIFMPENKKEVA